MRTRFAHERGDELIGRFVLNYRDNENGHDPENYEPKKQQFVGTVVSYNPRRVRIERAASIISQQRLVLGREEVESGGNAGGAHPTTRALTPICAPSCLQDGGV